MMFVKGKDEALLKSIMGVMSETAQQTEEQRKKAAQYLEKNAYAGMRLEESLKTPAVQEECPPAIVVDVQLTQEEIARLDEISKGTLGSYIKKATSSSDERSISNLSSRAADKLNNPVGNDSGEKDDHKSYLRSKGIARAVSRLTKEAVEGTTPKTAREKDLAAKAEPKDKITHKDVMAARGVAKEEVELDEGIEDRLEAAREKAAAKGKIKEKQPEAKPAVRKVAGKAYGGSKQKEKDDMDESVELDEISHALMGRYVSALQRKDSDVQRDKTKSQDEKIRSQLDMNKKLTKTWSKMQDVYQKQRNSPEGIAKRQAKAAAAKAGQKSFNDLVKSLQAQRAQNESVELDEASIHPMGVHVIRHPGGKMQVHAVGSKVQGIEVGEHLHDNDLDDLADMGHKIKEVKPKAVKESRSLSSIISKMVATQQVEEGFEVRFDDGTDEFIEAGIYEAVKAAVQALDEEASQQVTEYAFGSLTNFMNIHKMVS